MNLPARIKYALWKAGLYPDKCPYHGHRLLPHGWEGVNRVYTCIVPKCRMNG